MFSILGRALARILFFKETKSYESALLEIDNAGLSLLGLNTDALERLPVDGLRNVLGSDSSLLQSKFYTAGILLKERAEILELTGKEEVSAEIYVKSLRLLTEDLKSLEEVDGGKAIAAVDSIVGKLQQYELPDDLKRRLVQYFESSGRYDKSEDLIFEIAEMDPEYLRDGISFYERLLEKSDADLENGRLPRGEVEDALALLRKKLAAVG